MMKLNHHLSALVATSALLLASTASAIEVTYGVYWTKKAQAQQGGTNKIRSKTYQGHSIQNASHRNSKTNIVMQAKQFTQVTFDEGNSTLRSNYDTIAQGRAGNQRALETRFKTDINALITTKRGGGGAPNAVGWAAGAYAAINSAYLTGFTQAHEVGHCFNGDHRKANQISFPGGRRVTVMWPSLQGNMIGFFSNKNVRWNGYRTGNDSNNNAQRAIQVAPARARRR